MRAIKRPDKWGIEDIDDASPEEVAFRDKEYLYRIFYDIGYGASSNAMDAYRFIKPTCEAFLQSDEYSDCTKGLYESVERFINEHGWSDEIQSVNTLSNDYRYFEDFVFLYNQLSDKGEEFAIDDKCFDRDPHNEFIVSLTDAEIEHMGLSRLNRDTCKKKILSVLRGESTVSDKYCTVLDKYHIEKNTLVINDGVTEINTEDFHKYVIDEDGDETIELKDEIANIKSIIIPNSVTFIGPHAFKNCTSLKTIIIPDSVTFIGHHAFCNCKSLESIIIPDSVTYIDFSTFVGCESLTSITVPDSVTEIGEWTFADCESLTSITIPNSATSIGYNAFYNCKSLTSIIIPNSVTIIGGETFAGCESLTSITVPDSVTSIGNKAFEGCKSLTSITIPNSITSIGKWAFRCCDSLASITIPDSVTSVGLEAFDGCNNLTIKCNKGSYAEQFAKEHNFPVKHIKGKGETIERE